MSATRANALRKALKLGAPLAYASGRLAVLILKVERQTFAGENGWREHIKAKIVSVECPSRDHALIASRRALTDQALFAESHTPQGALEVSAMYAEATYRHALRRRRVA